MHEKTVQQHAAALRQGQYSSVELTTHFLDRIRQHPELNAFVTVTEEGALAQAAAADERIQSGDASPLTGIPIAQKDIFCTEGVLTTCGSKILENFISPYNATVISKMNAEGMVMLGKTNMDEFAMGSSNETSYFGAVQNPWDTSRVPGGSSGGSATAVAARLAPIATATDTGGSIRQPAAFCGLTGIKPSYGRVSRYGMIAFASSLDQGGVLARSAEDAALVLQAMSGFDPRDATSLQMDVPDYLSGLNDSIEGKVIGLPKEFFGDGIDSDIADAIQEAIKQFESMGAKTVEVALPNSEVGIPCYYVLAPAEASSNLSRFDGVRYGYRAEQYDDLTDMYEKTRAEGFGDEVKRRIMIGTYVL
nr:aspartyl/glutamyl-tRNA amidotransferase subunit A [Acidiferrobacterales bacterium]